MFNTSLSSKTLMKRVNYLLSTVNLSFDLLVGLRKGTIYRLLKKATKINPNLYLDKQELKEVANQIATYSLTSKETVRIYKKLLRLKDFLISSPEEKHELSFDANVFLGTFFDKKQIIRV